MAWITPVCDRTQDDVDRIKELTKKGYFNLTDDEKVEWEQDSKGCLNTSDLERIEGNINVIYYMLGEIRPLVTIPEIPNVSYYSYLRERVNDIRTKAVARKYSSSTVPDSPLNYFWKWNEIEKLLLDVYTVLSENEKAVLYLCDDSDTEIELYIGE